MKNKLQPLVSLIEKLLPNVQKPSRYIDHEWNAVKKQYSDQMLRVCLCFPDLYEVGSSNLGISILYQTINQRPDAVAERCFTPADDMDALMREQSIPLFSLESHTPLSSFDVVGFTLQYELCATNILSMLHSAVFLFMPTSGSKHSR